MVCKYCGSPISLQTGTCTGCRRAAELKNAVPLERLLADLTGAANAQASGEASAPVQAPFMAPAPGVCPSPAAAGTPAPGQNPSAFRPGAQIPTPSASFRQALQAQPLGTESLRPGTSAAAPAPVAAASMAGNVRPVSRRIAAHEEPIREESRSRRVPTVLALIFGTTVLLAGILILVLSLSHRDGKPKTRAADTAPSEAVSGETGTEPESSMTETDAAPETDPTAEETADSHDPAEQTDNEIQDEQPAASDEAQGTDPTADSETEPEEGSATAESAEKDQDLEGGSVETGTESQADGG